TVQTAAKVLDSTRKALEARRLELLPQATKEWREKMAVEVRANIDNLKIKMAFSKQLETELEGAVKQYNNIAQKINLGNLNVEMMTDDIAAVERVAKKVADELEAMDAERKAPPLVNRLEDGVTIRQRR